MTDTPDDREWESGWEGHSRAQQERLAKLPFAEKLAWLEEMHHVMLAMQRSKVEADADAIPKAPDPEKP